MTGGVGKQKDVKRILFVCIENSNRSQMAEAFARMLGGDWIEAFSVGSNQKGASLLLAHPWFGHKMERRLARVRFQESVVDVKHGMPWTNRSNFKGAEKLARWMRERGRHEV